MASELSRLIEDELRHKGYYVGGEEEVEEEPDPNQALMGALRVEARVKEQQSSKTLISLKRAVSVGGGIAVVLLVTLLLIMNNRLTTNDVLREQQGTTGQPQRPTAWIEDQNNTTSPFMLDPSLTDDSKDSQESDSNSTTNTSLQDGTTTPQDSAQPPDAPAIEQGNAGTFEMNPPVASDSNTTAQPAEIPAIDEPPSSPVSSGPDDTITDGVSDSSETNDSTSNSTAPESGGDDGLQMQTNVTNSASVAPSSNETAPASDSDAVVSPPATDAGAASDESGAGETSGDQERQGSDGLTATEETAIEKESEAEYEAEEGLDEYADPEGRHHKHRRLRF